MSYLQNMSPSQLFGARPVAWTPALPIALFSVGLLLGAGLALFLTPKTGRELRSDLSQQAKKLGTAVRDRMPLYGPRDQEDADAQWENAASMP